MKAHFYLRNNKIYVYVNINNVKQRFSTGIECNSDQWTKGFPKRREKIIIQQVQRIETPLNEYLATEIIPSTHTIKNIIEETINGKASDRQSLTTLIDTYLSYKQKKVVYNSFKSTKHNMNHFKTFVKDRNVNDLNSKLIKDYSLALEKTGLMYSSMNVYLKDVQTFLNYLVENEISTFNYKVKKFKEDTTNIIALTQGELNTLETASLPKRLDRVRDLFLLSCYTALRYSDVRRIEKRMITPLSKGQVLTIQQQKTNHIINIPLWQNAINILEKYDYSLPQISNQKTNKYLKEIFTNLELTRPVYDKNVLTDLNDCITFHVARKTFITIALALGMPAKMVQAISGHKNDSTFNKYIQFANDSLMLESEILQAKYTSFATETYHIMTDNNIMFFDNDNLMVTKRLLKVKFPEIQ